MRVQGVEQRWLLFLGAFLVIAIFNEAVVMSLARNTDDGALWFVTLRFVLLPLAALALLIIGAVQLLRARTSALRLLAGIAVGVGLIYLIELWWWPMGLRGPYGGP
jgi:hypothetical protein